MSTDDGAYKVPGWQVKAVAGLMLSAIAAGVGNYLSFRDWRVKTDLTLQQIQAATALPRTEWTLERQFLYAKIEEQNARISLLESRRGQ